MPKRKGDDTLWALSLKNLDVYQALFGMNDQYIRVIEQEFSVSIVLRNNGFHIQGDEPMRQMAHQVIDKLTHQLYEGQSIDVGMVRYLCSLVRDGHGDRAEEIFSDVVACTFRGHRIRCKTAGDGVCKRHAQQPLTVAIGRRCRLTYLAIAMAVLALRNKDVERIILTRL